MEPRGRHAAVPGSESHDDVDHLPGDRRMTKLVRSLVQDTSGATAVEYGLMIALIAAIIFLAVSLLGESVSNLFSDQELDDALS
jgi:pilus assembly protein Flp/PilA